MATRVFERRYYGTTNDNGHNVAEFWVSRERENGETVYTGGVSFGSRVDGGHGYRVVRTKCFDGISFVTDLEYAPRASKKRDNSACKNLYTFAGTQDNVVAALEGMGVYGDVYDDSARKVWER